MAISCFLATGRDQQGPRGQPGVDGDHDPTLLHPHTQQQPGAETGAEGMHQQRRQDPALRGRDAGKRGRHRSSAIARAALGAVTGPWQFVYLP